VPLAADEPVLTWVVGASGLLGSAVRRRLERDRLPWVSTAVCWPDPAAAVRTLRAAARTLSRAERPWRVAWCAGAGVVGTGPTELAAETEVLRALLAELTGLVTHGGQAPQAFFLASSAGGVLAGSADPPFDEQTEPRPISPYGEAKLRSERLVQAFAASTGVACLVGRIANLYGPGQDIRKPQGLVSQLCRAHLTRRPISIYVSLDTARDYLFVDDAAALVVAGLDRASREGGTSLKILATERTTSVAAILAELRRVTKRPVQVVLGANPNARFQVRDLRLRSTVWTDLNREVRTPLPAGISATLAAVSGDLRSGRLH
jgi:UDP-glucose 4-epimerase